MASLAGREIALLAVDEAHCISEWGHNFRPEYLKLARLARRLEVPRVLALTATATPEVARSIAAAFAIDPPDVVLASFHRPNLELHAISCRPEDRRSLLLDRMAHRPSGPAIVYVTLQKTAEELASFLASHGHPAEPYHAGLADEVRHAVQERFHDIDRPGRGRDDRVRDGDRQVRHPARAALQLAQGARELRPGDRPGGPRRPALPVRPVRLRRKT